MPIIGAMISEKYFAVSKHEHSSETPKISTKTIITRTAILLEVKLLGRY